MLGHRWVVVGALGDGEDLDIVLIEDTNKYFCVDVVISECLVWNGDTNNGMTASNNAMNNSWRHIIIFVQWLPNHIFIVNFHPNKTFFMLILLSMLVRPLIFPKIKLQTFLYPHIFVIYQVK